MSTNESGGQHFDFKKSTAYGRRHTGRMNRKNTESTQAKWIMKPNQQSNTLGKKDSKDQTDEKEYKAIMPYVREVTDKAKRHNIKQHMNL